MSDNIQRSAAVARPGWKGLYVRFKNGELFDPRLRAELVSQKRPIGLGLLCTAVAALLSVGTALLLKFGVHAIELLAAASTTHSASPTGMRDLILSCLAVVGLFGARYWFVRGQTYYLSEAANRLAMELRLRMMKKLLRLPISYFNDRRSGNIQSVLTNDVNVYQNAVGIIRDGIEGPIKAIGAFGLVIWLQWQLSILAILLIPIMGWVIQQNSRQMRSAQRRVQEKLADVSGTTMELLQGARIIKAFGAEEATDERYDSLVNQSFQSQMKATAITAALRPMVDLIGAAAIALFIYFCGILAYHGQVKVEDIMAMVYAMDTINQGFRSLAGVTNTYATVQAASARIYSEILEVPEGHETSGGKQLPKVEGRVEFENVSFCYPDGTEALSNVSFVIEPGTSLALVGPSGAGKSTVADLLLRFYDPTEGRILFDGVDVRDLDVNWLRSQIGVVPQHTFLFAGSIEDNVRMGDPCADRADLQLALRQAHAEEFTNEMNDRPTTELGERGLRLSGGQMQRIAIARALIRKPTVLLLDEATSALDATSEKAVTEALDEVMQTRTTLFIAHRLTTAARANRILVLSRGQVVETGSHNQLIEANGPYAGLFRAFSGGILG